VTAKSTRRCPASDKYQLPQLGNIVSGAFTPVLAKPFGLLHRQMASIELEGFWWA